MRPTHPAAAALAVTVLLLSGCSPSADPTSTPNASPTASASAQPSASPTPSSTLTAAQEQAFTDATNVVMAYRQTITDLYSGARTRINDLDNYATGDMLDRGRLTIAQALAAGRYSEPKGVQLTLVSAEPVTVKLDADPPTVVLWACIDATAGSDVLPDGTREEGVRAEAQYRVVKTTYLPDPGWAVADVKAAPDPKDRTC